MLLTSNEVFVFFFLNADVDMATGGEFTISQKVDG